jgi:hypothetical protein
LRWGKRRICGRSHTGVALTRSPRRVDSTSRFRECLIARALPRLKPLTSPQVFSCSPGRAGRTGSAGVCSSEQVAFVAFAGGELWRMHCSPYSPRHSPGYLLTLRRPAPRHLFCQPASSHRCKYPDPDSLRTLRTAQTQGPIAISMPMLPRQVFCRSSCSFSLGFCRNDFRRVRIPPFFKELASHDGRKAIPGIFEIGLPIDGIMPSSLSRPLRFSRKSIAFLVRLGGLADDGNISIGAFNGRR